MSAELTAEQYEDLPEFLKASYVKDGDGYSHGGFVKVKGTANELDRKAKEREAELESYRSEEQKRIDAARLEAYEKAKSEGHTDEVERQLMEKIADAERRSTESEKQFKERLARLADKSKSAIASEVSTIAIKGGAAAFKRLVKDYIQVDPETDQETYLDDNGRATSLNRAEFIEELKKNPLFKPLIMAGVATEGGGNVNGSQKAVPSGKKFNELSGSELKSLRELDPSAYDRLKNEFYSK